MERSRAQAGSGRPASPVSDRDATSVLDVGALLSFQHHHLAAVIRANQLAVDCARAVSARQLELMRAIGDDLVRAASLFNGSTDPSRNAERQADLARDIFEKTAACVNDIGEVARRSSMETAEAFSQCFRGLFGEMRTVADPEHRSDRTRRMD